MDGRDSGREFFSYALTWEDQSYIEPYLKVAVQSGLPPRAILLNDPTIKEWAPIDIKLAKAYELRQTYGDIPPWIDRSDRVQFEARTFVSKSAAAIERKQDQDSKKKSRPGVRYYAVPKVVDGGPMPTMAEYYEELARKEGRKA